MKNTEKKINRQKHEIDVSGQVLGRVSTKIAKILMGKNKASYSRNNDYGDYVIVINAGKIIITGNKMTQKKYKSYSGYPGGLKTESLRDVFEKNPREVIKRTVKKMLPKNKLLNERIKRLQFK
ncbi:50S ribosomal protein L13 [Candidatus Parcubacteria bacterium]|nr:MAG: 50S ribosomal protein L13 [Candidatus Parcubacteria bacterium]